MISSYLRLVFFGWIFLLAVAMKCNAESAFGQEMPISFQVLDGQPDCVLPAQRRYFLAQDSTLTAGPPVVAASGGYQARGVWKLDGSAVVLKFEKFTCDESAELCEKIESTFPEGELRIEKVSDDVLTVGKSGTCEVLWN